MKVVIISDTHGTPLNEVEIPECDLLLHCGDIAPNTDHNKTFQWQWFNEVFKPELSQLPAKNIVFIGGNHDFFLEESMLTKSEDAQIRQFLPKNCTYLRDSEVTIEGLRIYGSPWVINLKRWAFNHNHSNAVIPSVAKIPDGLDILMTHGPARGYGDTIKERGLTEKLGSFYLTARIETALPRYVFCGHIHSGEHSCMLDLSTGTRYFNTSVLDESYQLHYPPLVLEIEPCPKT